MSRHVMSCHVISTSPSIRAPRH